MTSNCITTIEIGANHLGKYVIDEGEMPSLKPSQMWITVMDGKVLVQENARLCRIHTTIDQ